MDKKEQAQEVLHKQLLRLGEIIEKYTLKPIDELYISAAMAKLFEALYTK